MVDDEIQPDDALVRLLGLDGFRVVCARTGSDGIALALGSRWDVIALDLHLPDVLGITVLSAFRQHGVTAPVIVMTGWYLDGGHDEAAAALGAAGFVRKPLAAEELGRLLRSAAAAATSEPPRGFPPKTKLSTGLVQPPSPKRTRSVREEDSLLRSLHTRAGIGDAPALDRLCELVLPALEHSSYGLTRVDRDWVHDAAQDAIIELRANVHRFDSQCGVSLTSFLRMGTRRNLLNRIDRERRRAMREIAVDTSGRATQSLSVVPDYERAMDLRKAVAAVWAGLSVMERRVFRVILEGERRTEALAQAAETGHWEPRERHRATRRITNRIFERMRRMRARA